VRININIDSLSTNVILIIGDYHSNALQKGHNPDFLDIPKIFLASENLIKFVQINAPNGNYQ